MNRIIAILGIVITIIGFFNLDLAIRIAVNAIIVALFVTLLIRIGSSHF